MNQRDDRITQILVEAKLIDELQHRSVRARQAKWGTRPHHIVVEQGFADEDKVADALAAAFGTPRVNLSERTPDNSAIARLTVDFCEQHNVIPLAVRDGGKLLWLVMDDPSDIKVLDEVRVHARVARVAPAVAGYQEIRRAIRRHYHGTSTVSPRFSDGVELGSVGSDDEFQMVDTLGNTLVKPDQGIAELRHELKGSAPAAPTSPPQGSDVFANATIAPAPRPIAPTARPVTPHQPGGGAFADSPLMAPTATPLEDLAGQVAVSPQLGERLSVVRESLDRADSALRVIVKACVKRGYFTMEEFRARFER